MKQRLLIVGAGGHARVVSAIVRQVSAWEIVGLLDRNRPVVPEEIDGVPVTGSFDEALRFFEEGVRNATIALGDNEERAALFDRLSDLGFEFPVLRHPTSIIEDNVTLGAGCVICAGAILCARVVIGKDVIVNTGAILDHETVVGDHAHVAPGCRIAGRVRIGSGAFIGIGTSVCEKLTVGASAIVGAGSVVLADVPDGVVAFGCPARVDHMRKR
jgi:sugar O-acyltransferase (sialic acid O-acetyltransferase NeuD family)